MDDTKLSCLLCTEETESCVFDVDPFDGQSCQTNESKGIGFDNGASESEPLVHVPCLNEQDLGFMVEREQNHLPKHDYLMRLRNGVLDMSLRREAVNWISKVHAHFNFGAMCLCLAITYFDRFLSLYDLPGNKTWTFQLLAVACISLAAKMEETSVPSTVDLQVGRPRFMFEGKTIRRMELLVLGILKWKMQAYSPLNFIAYFLRKLNDDKSPTGPLINRSIQLILSTIKGIDFLEFKPSEIAAAVAICVSGEIQPMDIDKALSALVVVEKGRVVECLERLQNLTSTSGTTSTASGTTLIASGTVSSVPQSPNGVLEAACLSYKSDERGSCPSSSNTSPDTKRRKLDHSTTIEGGDS